MEKRKNRRVNVSGDVSGRMVLVSDLDIKDLSLTGIRFRCHGRVVPESRINLVIVKDGLKLNLPGRIVRSTIKKLEPSSPGEPMGHEVGVAFDTLSPDARASLEKLILLVEQDRKAGSEEGV